MLGFIPGPLMFTSRCLGHSGESGFNQMSFIIVRDGLQEKVRVKVLNI